MEFIDKNESNARQNINNNSTRSRIYKNIKATDKILKKDLQNRCLEIGKSYY